MSNIIKNLQETSTTITKLASFKASLMAEKNRLSEAYTNLGKLTYLLATENTDEADTANNCNAENASNCINSIHKSLAKIKELEDKINKEKNRKCCPKCGTFMDKDMRFCGNCGEKFDVSSVQEEKKENSEDDFYAVIVKKEDTKHTQ